MPAIVSQAAFIPFGKLIQLTHPVCHGRRVAVLFESYWDDSNEDESKYFGVGGFIGVEDSWRSLEPKWLAALPEGIDYFHATDCFSGNNQFEPSKGFPKPRRVELLDRLTDLICETDIKLVCTAVYVPYYVRLAPKKIENRFFGNQYVLCMEENLLAACQDYMNPRDEPYLIDTGDVCAIFYEESMYTDSVGRSVRQLREDAVIEWRSRIGNAVPGTKTGASKIPLLQVADLGAFLGTKYAGEARDGAIPWRPYYDKLYKAGRVWRVPRWTKQRINFLWTLFNVDRDKQIMETAIKDVWPEE